RTARRHRRPGPSGGGRDRQVLVFDRLEDRTLMTISPVLDLGNSNNVGFLGIFSDTLYLKADPSGLLEWSPDGTNFTTNIGPAGQTVNLAPSAAGPTTITVSTGTVDLEDFTGGGRDLTIQALGAPSGGGTLMATQVNISPCLG